MAKFWITAPRYLQQRGQSEPAYVDASPNNPTLIDLPDDVKPSRNMRPAEEKPEKPLPAHSTVEKPAVKRAPDAIKGKRAADAE